MFDQLVDDTKQAILRSKLPVVTSYQIARLMHGLKGGEFGAEGLVELVRKVRGGLEKGGLLVRQPDFKSDVWYVVGASRAASAEEAVCIADPFAWVSHLSAMYRYGLTNRSPAALHMTSPEDEIWNQMRRKALEDLGLGAEDMSRRILNRIGRKGPVRGRAVSLHQTVELAQTDRIAGEATRIASIGSVFASMVQEPDLCGGMSHVIECYADHAEPWLDKIIAAINRTDSKIAKLRAGCILDEMLGLRDTRILQWKEFRQPGGSNRLDPKAPPGGKRSFEWDIYINV